jgi:hypothetical protein
MPARPLLTSIAVVLALVLDLVAGPTATGLPSPQITPRAIGTTRKAATVAALARFPFFFHTQPVRVRGKATEKDGLFQLEHERRGCGWSPAAPASCPIPARTPRSPGSTSTSAGSNARTPRHRRLRPLIQRVLHRDWPAPGELLVVVVDTRRRAEPMNAPSVRHVALDPGRYSNRKSPWSGRFRGKNLYGDMPEGRRHRPLRLRPAVRRRLDLGRRPAPQGRRLRPERREPHRHRALARSGRRGQGGARDGGARGDRHPRRTPPAESAPEAVVKVPIAVPPPEVVFSAPTQGETDVAPDAKVRVQFSRDLREDSLKGGIAVAYAGVPRRRRRSRCATTPGAASRRSTSRHRCRRSPTCRCAEGHDRRHGRPGAAALHAGVHRRQLSAAARAAVAPLAPAPERAHDRHREERDQRQQANGDAEREHRKRQRERSESRRRRRPRTGSSAQFENGSGEALAATRVDALVTCEAAATPPPSSAGRGLRARRRLAERGHRDEGAADRPNHRVHGVPDGVDPRHLVGDELDRVADEGAPMTQLLSKTAYCGGSATQWKREASPRIATVA